MTTTIPVGDGSGAPAPPVELPTGPESAPDVPGVITVADRVVERIAAQVASGVADVGGAGGGLGRRLGLGGQAELGGLPDVTARVDSGIAELRMTLSVRWTARVDAVADAVRSAVRENVRAWTGVQVEDISITVSDLVVPPAPSRVR